MTVCRSCGAWFVWPPPSSADLLAHYATRRSGMPAELRRMREGTAQNRWYASLARKMASLRPDAVRVADVGAGALELTGSLAAVLPRARVEGWDLFSDGLPPPPASGVVLRRIDLNHIDIDSMQRFDLVGCVAVIEHVLQPLELLRSLHALLAPGGLAFVVGPRARAPAHLLMGRRWPYYCPDEHLTLPSLRSIERAMELLSIPGFRLRRTAVGYSLRYLLRFFGLPTPFAGDVVIPVPSGAFELIWSRAPEGGSVSGSR